ncbi:alpha/beta hydrolase [Mycobacterium sp. MS1601]|uniref:alpha/beta hydrolase n=1 Tax=Mycobacterium sp. MS1601 TaxID=1936029 RepID=UPI0009794F7F|nr:alpha/beta fold hydrolase [Mycobacterium sp. MS1601]AQA03399.1 alpha/beta hydrolase [Mycobacterium sp. MS1601]
MIDRGDPDGTPLLFVHGAFHGAWCWDEHFLEFFASRGYRAVALNLRQHPGDPTGATVADYVADVRAAADTLPRPPVVIGHSMGGFVVQKYLAAHTAPAGVLLASAPPYGLGKAALRVARRNARHSGRPAALRRPLLFFGAPAVARNTFYSDSTPAHLVARYTERLCDESTRALYRDLLYADLAEPAKVSTPLLVLGAASDGFFSQREVCATAKAYRTHAEFFPDMGHNLMLEPGWPMVAQRIHSWLSDLLL